MRSQVTNWMLVATVVIGLSIAHATAAQARQSDPLTGTWALNLAKSKYSPGPAPKSEVVTYEAAATGVKYSVARVDSTGKSSTLQGSLMYDGKDYPSTGTADYDTVSTRRVNATTTESTRKKAGKTVQTVSRVLSADGKTMTLTVKGSDAQGRSINDVAVYDRRP